MYPSLVSLFSLVIPKLFQTFWLPRIDPSLPDPFVAEGMQIGSPTKPYLCHSMLPNPLAASRDLK